MVSRDYRSLRMEHTNFTWSKPVGYDFKEVDSAMEELKKTISDANEIIEKKESVIQLLKDENNRLVDEVTNSRIQLESVMAPTMSRDSSVEILNDFTDNTLDISEEDIDSNVIDSTASSDKGSNNILKDKIKSSHAERRASRRAAGNSDSASTNIIE